MPYVGFCKGIDDAATEDIARKKARIARKKRDDVFLPREFADLGGEDQVLRSPVQEGHLVCLGYGVYGRAVVSQLSDKPILYSPNGYIGTARQALTKLGGQCGKRQTNSGRIQRREMQCLL